MKSNDLSISELCNTRKFKLDEDVQRNYEWNPNNVKRFIEDLDTKDEGHWIGTFLIYENPEDKFTYIFDGQQRFTTIVLCAAVIRNKLKKCELKEESEVDFNDLKYNYLKKPNRGNCPYKLTLREDDNETLKEIINEEKITNEKSFVYKNFKQIENILENYNEEQLFLLIRKINNAKIITLCCDSMEEGRTAFYYQNSGQPLSETRRLIALTVINSENNKEDKEDNEKFASEISNNVNEDDINTFFSLFTWYHYDTPYVEKNLPRLETDLKTNKNNIYKELRNFYYKWAKPLIIDKNFIDERKIYNFVFNNGFQGTTYNVIYLFIIKILEQTISEKEKINALKLMEWVTISKRLEDNTGAAKRMSAFLKDINKEDICNSIRKNAEEKKWWLLSNECVSKLNEDEIKKDIYITLLKRINSNLTRENATIESKITLEHIFPQKPDSKYNYDDNNIPCNRFGNLTLLTNSLNSSLKNKPFTDKKEEYKKAYYKTTTRLENYQKWTIQEVEETEKFYCDEIKKYYGIE